MANLRERAEKYAEQWERSRECTHFENGSPGIYSIEDAYEAGFREAIRLAVEKSKGGGSCYYDCGDWIRGEILSLVIGPEPSSPQVGT